MSETVETGASVWCLEGFVDDSSRLFRIPLHTFPFDVGRSPDCALTLTSGSVSQRHAEISLEGGGVRVRDLASTNGTFVNRERVEGDAPIDEGDILHFSDQEFRLFIDHLPRSLETATLDTLTLPRRLAANTRELRKMMDEGAVSALFQPIVGLDDGRIVGYESLGRGSHRDLPTAPTELFLIAGDLGLECELSRLFRSAAIRSLQGRDIDRLIFLNTHPNELDEPEELLESLEKARAAAGDLGLVLEIHESTVTRVHDMQRIRQHTLELDIGLSYDDFGAGQARLVELVEVPPDYLKFDMRLIHELHLAREPKRRMIATLVEMTKDLGIKTVAEGIETQAEIDICREVGFELGQGFRLGRPQSQSSIHLGPTSET